MSKTVSPKKERLACAISGRERPRRELVNLEMVRPSLRRAHPRRASRSAPDALVSRQEVAPLSQPLRGGACSRRESGDLTELDRQVAAKPRHATRRLPTTSRRTSRNKRTLGERLSDHLATLRRQLDVHLGLRHRARHLDRVQLWRGRQSAFDPYPFILLNLVLSCLAAIQAPIIMMSQKRQEAKDRLRGSTTTR